MKYFLKNIIKKIIFIGIICTVGMHTIESSVSIRVNGERVQDPYYLYVCIIIAVVIVMIDTIQFYLANRTFRKKYDYYRELPRTYSPSIVSLLTNLKVEPKKDLVADLLFLSQKGIVKIDKYEPYRIYLLNPTYVFGENENHLRMIIKYLKNEKVETWNLEENEYDTISTPIELDDILQDKIFQLYYKNAVKQDALQQGLITRKFPDFSGMIKLWFMVPFLSIFMFTFFMNFSANVFLFFIIAIRIIPIMFALLSMLYVFIFIRSFLATTRPFRSKKGKEDVGLWFSYYNFLKHFGNFKDKEFAENELWGYYFAYGLALGLNKRVIRKFALNGEENMVR